MAEAHNRSAPLSVSYDSHTDTCYFFVEAAGPGSVARDVGNGVLVQYEPTAGRPIGLIIHDFEARFAREGAPCQISAIRATLQSA